MKGDRDEHEAWRQPPSSFPTQITVTVNVVVRGGLTLKVMSVPAPTSDADLAKLSDVLDTASDSLETATAANPVP